MTGRGGGRELGHGLWEPYAFDRVMTPQALVHRLSLLAVEIQEMESLCRDRERHIFLAKDAFPLTENVGYCRNRQFRELCERVDGMNSAGA